jgi:acido-empty-quinoprotein group A
MTLRALALFGCAVVLHGQPLDPAKLLQPATDAWPTFNGDYSGRRFSTLTQIDSRNVRNLSLAWAYRADVGPGSYPFGVQIKGTPLLVNGILYVTMPDHVWALDARTGAQLWHFKWDTTGGIHIGNRGVGIYGDWLFFETPDNHLVSLDIHSGKLRWSMTIADVKQQYFSTPAPLVIGNHVIVGVGGDSLDVPGFLEARDPETGRVQWRWDTAPKPGANGSDTWPNVEAMRHGGGMTWLPGTYDPQLNLLYWGTGNPNPVHAGQGRAGSNLWTCSIVALNPDNGELAWWFQTSPHDTHDWDGVQTPVLFDAEIDGKPRKLLAQGARNGYFFVVDRVTGKSLVSKPFVKVNWSKGLDEKGQPIPDPAKEPQTDGSFVNPSGNGATNWPAPTYNPNTGLFYLSTVESYAVYYLTDTDPKPEGYGGRENTVFTRSSLKAIDAKTGDVRWTHDYPGPGGNVFSLLTTAGGLLFSGDPSRNFIAFDPIDGKPLWHVRLAANVSNGPITYLLDGRQYVLVAGGDELYAFRLTDSKP